jgi:hypothetical protein
MHRRCSACALMNCRALVTTVSICQLSEVLEEAGEIRQIEPRKSR